jgi:GGDEF domain-containing protein
MHDAHAIPHVPPALAPEPDPPHEPAARRARALVAALLTAIAATAAARVATGSESALFPLAHVALALAAGWLLAWEAALAAAWLTAVAAQVPTVVATADAAPLTAIEGLALTAVAGGAVLALRNARETAAATAATGALPLADPASGLANEHAFELRAAAELARARRHELPLTVLWLALDGIDPAAPGPALRRLGAAALGALRGEDLVARVAGDELALLLPEAGPAGSDAIAARLEIALGRALAGDEELAGAHATVAAAHYPDDALTVDDLAAAARRRALEARAAARSAS